MKRFISLEGIISLLINFQINFEMYPMDGKLMEEVEPIRKVTITFQIRRTFGRWIKELF